jgi:hypothetical protein
MVSYSSHTVAGEIVVVGEGVQSRAKSSNFTSLPVRSLELVLAVH